MHAFVFPGQGSQFVGMGRDLYENHAEARALFQEAEQILGFKITEIMFEGTPDDLKQTRVTQPAVFLHSVLLAKSLGEAFQPAMVGGHSLGELSALVAAEAVSFADGLRIVARRAEAMNRCCEAQPGAMAAIIGLADDAIEQICAKTAEETGLVCVPANYNCPGQLVISGHTEAVNVACEHLKEAGAKRALVLPVSGAFHSPLMQPAAEELTAAIQAAEFKAPRCPIYQNFDGKAHTDAAEIQQNLIAQLTGSVRWTAEVEAMLAAGATKFTECGPGKALQGMIAKIAKGHEVEIGSALQ